MILSNAVKWLANIVSHKRLLIITYHRVFAAKDPIWPYDIDAKAFESHLKIFNQYFNVLRLDHAMEALAKGVLPKRALCLSFDDGYLDNYQVAYPLLKKWQCPAVFFIATDYSDGGIMWNDIIIESIKKVTVPHINLQSLGLGEYKTDNNKNKSDTIMSLIKSLKYKPQMEREVLVNKIKDTLDVTFNQAIMMNRDQIIEMKNNGMLIGAHTCSHPILSEISQAQAHQEIATGKSQLETLIGENIDYFAYPNGKPTTDYSCSNVESIRKIGFKAALTTVWGVTTANSDVYQIPRINLWEASEGQTLRTLLRAYYHQPQGLLNSAQNRIA